MPAFNNNTKREIKQVPQGTQKGKTEIDLGNLLESMDQECLEALVMSVKYLIISHLFARIVVNWKSFIELKQVN